MLLNLLFVPQAVVKTVLCTHVSTPLKLWGRKVVRRRRWRSCALFLHCVSCTLRPKGCFQSSEGWFSAAVWGNLHRFFTEICGEVVLGWHDMVLSLPKGSARMLKGGCLCDYMFLKAGNFGRTKGRRD